LFVDYSCSYFLIPNTYHINIINMAVVGLDMGNFSSYIGVARAGGVEIIANEYSDRLTPTYITFDKSTRSIGQASKAMEVTNAKNTINNFKRLLGRRYQDSYVQQEKEFNAYSIIEGNGGSVNIEVDYLNERKRFTPEQIAGIMFTKLRQITDTELKTKAVDCVIGVPCFFTDAERRAMLDAAQIAGWNCLRLLNETTAVALCYGIYKADLPEPTEKPRLVAFIDMGYTALQASVVAFNKGKLKMVATAFDTSLGGRDFDRLIMDAMRDDYQKRYKIDSYSTAKAKLRLKAECEKGKKLMSSNAQPIPIGLECFIDEKDVNGKMSRTDFEELAKPLLERIRNTLENLLKEAKVTVEELESVEIVGGSTRIPAVKQIIQDFFNKTPMTTMNSDESVARGCTLMCAILSPTFKVKEFKIEDCQPYPITLSWQGGVNEDNEVEVFGRWNVIPSTKMLSFYKREPLTVEARYSYPNDIPFSESRIGQYTIEQIQPQPDGTPSKIKVKVRLNRNGIFDVTQASLIETIEEPNAPTGPEEAMETAATASQATENGGDQNGPTVTEPMEEDKDEEGNETKQKTAGAAATKKKKKEIDLPISSRVPSATKSELDRLIEQELEMISQDKKEKERSDAKNSVEEYVYDMRGKVDGGDYEKYSDEKTRQKLLNDLRATEDWLYEDGMDQEKNVYVDRLKSLKSIGDPIRNRYTEAENRQHHMQELMKSVQRIDEAIQVYHTKSSDKYSHIDQSEIEKATKFLNDKQNWYDQTANRFNAHKAHEDPAILCSQIKQERDTLEKECWSILNRPKPKVEPPKDTDASKQQAPPTNNQQQQDQAPPQPPPSSGNPNQPSTEQQPSMEVD
jgi:heat shock protein 4